MAIEDCIGEVIESSTVEFVAESKELHTPPRFGSFVKVCLNSNGHVSNAVASPEPETEDPFEDRDPFRANRGAFNARYRAVVEGEPSNGPCLEPALFAVVYHATTSSTDSSRRTRAYWKDEDKLKEEQPELSEWLLMTEFRGIVVGHIDGGHIRRYLPPHPARMHSFVYECSPQEIGVLTSRLDFLRILANSRNAPAEELIAACIREAASQRGEDERETFMIAAGKELANLFKDDYERLEAIMRRVQS